MTRTGTPLKQRREDGTVTAEVAVAFPAVVALLAVILAAAGLGLSQLRIEEAARAGARELMRGESTAVVEDTVRRIAGEHARISVEPGIAYNTVSVTTTLDVPVLSLFEVDLSARAVALPEQK